MYRVFPQILCVTWMYWPVCYHHFQSWVVVVEAKFPVEFRAGSVIFHLVGSSSAHSNRVAREIRNFCNEEKSQRRYLLGSICQPLEHTTCTTQTKIQSCNLEQFLCALFYIFVFSCCLASFSNWHNLMPFSPLLALIGWNVSNFFEILIECHLAQN